MSVRFDAAADQYTLTGNLLGVGTSSITMWARIATDTNAFTSLFSVDDATNYLIVGHLTDGTTLVLNQSGNQVGSVAMTVGTWYFVAATYNGADTGSLYTAAVDDATIAKATGAIFDPPNAGATTYLGQDGFNEPFNGNLAAVKVWAGVQLSDAEVEAERWSVLPHRTDGLVAWYPLDQPSTVDYSGNGNTLTVGGTLTTEDGPPVAWRQGRRRRVAPVAGAASTVPLHVLNPNVPYAYGYRGAA